MSTTNEDEDDDDDKEDNDDDNDDGDDGDDEDGDITAFKNLTTSTNVCVGIKTPASKKMVPSSWV